MENKTIYDEQIVSIVKTVLERCQKEYDLKGLQVPLYHVNERATYYTGFSKTIVSEIAALRTESKYDSFDVPERNRINDALHVFYGRNKYPQYHHIFELIKDTVSMEDYHTFKKEMISLGFNYVPCLSGYILTENPKLRFERTQYLNKIRKFREKGLNILYIDVKIINKSNIVKDIDCIENKILTEYFFLHAVSNKGLVSYLFCNKISKEIFRKWLYELVLQVLEPKSVIVMNDNPLLGDKVDNTVTMYHTKAEMLNWLNNNNVPCNDNMLKADLYEIIEKCSKNENSYAIDKVIKAYGHEILHLPYKCNTLSLTEWLWKAIKTTKIELSEKFPTAELKYLLIENIETVVKIKFPTFDEVIKNWENKTFDIDARNEQVLDVLYKFDIQKIKDNYVL